MSPHRKAVETRRLYKFEHVFNRHLPPEVRRARPIAALRDIAHGVWAGHGRRGAQCPEIVAGSGVPQNGVWLSYYDDSARLPLHRIVLSRGQRTVAVLLHELTHALGHDTHGKGFVDQYVKLLCIYGGCEEGELRLGLSLFNIR